MMQTTYQIRLMIHASDRPSTTKDCIPARQFLVNPSVRLLDSKLDSNIESWFTGVVSRSLSEQRMSNSSTTNYDQVSWCCYKVPCSGACCPRHMPHIQTRPPKPLHVRGQHTRGISRQHTRHATVPPSAHNPLESACLDDKSAPVLMITLHPTC